MSARTPTVIPILIFLAALCPAAEAEPSATPFETGGAPAPVCKIDELVFSRLKDLHIEPAALCSDAVFLRRVYLDVTGTLPTPDAVRAFLADATPGKRERLVDHLLDQDAFADYLALRWSDLLRVKAEFPINLWPHAAQMYHRWIRTCFRDNLPCDRFARELLTANGSNFRTPPVNFYRAMQNREPQGIAQTVALTFMGTRAEKWPKDRLDGMAAFFSRLTYKQTAEWKEEIVFFDPSRPLPATAPVFPDGNRAQLSPDQDPRAVFADWLLAPSNPWFAQNLVNRSWSWLLGRGIIHEPDDARPDNPPSNPALLTYLQREFIASGFDLQRLFRLILNSRVYQLSSIPQSDRPDVHTQFARYPLRRLDAEVLIDAICQITGTTEKYVSSIPEPFTYIPEEERSITLPDGSISSSFLELFGRPPRDTGLESERNNRPTAAQRLHLLNSSHIRKKIEQSPTFAALFQSAKQQEEVVTGLYLAILSRYPTGNELGITAPSKKPKSRDAMFDVAWALMNTSEFLCRH